MAGMRRSKKLSKSRGSLFAVKTLRKQGTRKFPLNVKVLVTKGALRGRTGKVAGHEKRLGKTTGILVNFGGRGMTARVGTNELLKI